MENGPFAQDLLLKIIRTDDPQNTPRSKNNNISMLQIEQGKIEECAILLPSTRFFTPIFILLYSPLTKGNNTLCNNHIQFSKIIAARPVS